MNYIITALVLLGYELNVFFNLKPLFGIPKEEYKKPIDCFFCLSFWFNTVGLIALHVYIYYHTGELKVCYTQIEEYAYCIIITKIVDKL